VTVVSFGIGMTYALQGRRGTGQAGDRGRGHQPALPAPHGPPHVIESVKKTNRCITIEEGWPQGSVGSYIGSRSCSRPSTISTPP
jgi:pyruvate dehydrogenase E1 component beta subunit